MNPTGKALGQATRHFHRQTRLADPARTRDRDQAHVLAQQEFFGGGYFLFAPHKSGSLHGNIGRAGSACWTGFSEKRSRIAASSRARSRVEA